jgi:hypothetical protein
VERGGGGFDGVDGLIETVEGSVEFAGGIFGEMENEVELGFARLESAGVDAFDRGRGDLSVGRDFGGEEEGEKGDVKETRQRRLLKKSSAQTKAYATWMAGSAERLGQVSSNWRNGGKSGPPQKAVPTKARVWRLGVIG